MARARSDLPVPGSPTISTGARDGAIVVASSRTCRRLESSPIMPSSWASSSTRGGLEGPAAGPGFGTARQGIEAESDGDASRRPSA